MLAAVAVLSVGVAFAQGRKSGEALPEDKVVFDFETPADVATWTPAKPPEVRDEQPAAKVEFTAEHATAGKGALKLTFDGGTWPAVVTTTIPVDEGWEKFQTIKLDVWVPRDCIVGMCITQEKGNPKPANAKPEDPMPPPNRWWKMLRLVAGPNDVDFPLVDRWYGVQKQFGKVVSFTLVMYQPRKGESIVVDNVRLSARKVNPAETGALWSPYCQAGFSMPAKRDWARSPKWPEFKVLGTDLVVKDVGDLGKKLKDKWAAAPEKTIDQVETEIRAQFDELKKTHPKAVLAIFRDGEKGWDPANPDKVYDGWRDAYVNCHGPDAPGQDRERAHGKGATSENFMRHRGLLMQADLSCLPKGSEILAAKFVLVTTGTYGKPQKPNMYACEPCCREWDEATVNCYEYAPGKLWKQMSGCYYGEDPDFLPVYIAHGQATPPTDVWDFTEALKLWVSGEHPNRGFFLHGDAGEYETVFLREAKDVKQRPAILVVYEPK
jgi:hypothetical protein